MKQKVPHSPFTTRLSGSAKETELRLRNIFQWKKKRPPVILFVLTVVVLFSCFGLVSCQAESENTEPSDVVFSDIGTIPVQEQWPSTVPVYVNEYPYGQEGPLYDITDKETSIMEANSKNFLSLLYGEETAQTCEFTYNTNPDYRVIYQTEHTEIVSMPNKLSVLTTEYPITRDSIENDLRANPLLTAAIRYLDIQDPKVVPYIHCKTDGTPSNYIYKIVQNSDELSANMHNSSFSYLLLSLSPDNDHVLLQIFKYDIPTQYIECGSIAYDEAFRLLQENFPSADLNSVKAELYYSPGTYHTPTCRFYIPQEDGEWEYNGVRYSICDIPLLSDANLPQTKADVRLMVQQDAYNRAKQLLEVNNIEGSISLSTMQFLYYENDHRCDVEFPVASSVYYVTVTYSGSDETGQWSFLNSSVRTPTQILTSTDNNDPFAVLAAIERISPDDLISPLKYDYGNTPVDRLTAALNGAADNQIPEETVISQGYISGMRFPHWTEDVYYDIGQSINSTEHPFLRIQCGLTESITKVTYFYDEQQSYAYLEDEVLYWLIRRRSDAAETIDSTAFSRFETVLIPQMEQTLTELNDDTMFPDAFSGYELTQFYPLWEYEAADGSRVELYNFGYVLIPKDPTRMTLAGGAYLDSELRVHGYGVGQFAVRYRNGEIVSSTFMGNDFFFSPQEDEEYLTWAKERLTAALDRAENN